MRISLLTSLIFSPDRKRGPNMKIKSLLTTTVLLAGAGALVYKFGLSDSAKESLRESARSVSDAARSIVETVEDMAGIVVDDGPLYNREQTEREWEALGY